MNVFYFSIRKFGQKSFLEEGKISLHSPEDSLVSAIFDCFE